MNKVQLFHKKIAVIKQINKHLPSEWKAFLYGTIIGHITESDPMQGLIRVPRLGEDIGYLDIQCPNGRSSTIYDWQDRSGFKVNEKYRRSPALLASDVVARVLERGKDDRSKQVDFDRLYQIKSQNRGVVIDWPTSEIVSEQLRNLIPSEHIDKFMECVEVELERCQEFNRATHIFGMGAMKWSSQVVFQFSVKCEAIDPKDEYNWHLQNTSQWLYAGAVVYSDGRVSTHH